MDGNRFLSTSFQEFSKPGEFANSPNVTSSSLSQAFHSDEGFLANNFLRNKDVIKEFRNVFVEGMTMISNHLFMQIT